MKTTNSVSDFVAATMDAVLKSEQHKSLFGTQYKYASDENAGKDSFCAEHGEVDNCSADSPPPPPPKKDPATGATVSGDAGQHITFPADKITADKAKADDSFAWDDNDARKKKKKDEDEEDEEKEDKKDEDDASDAELTSSAYDVAIDSLLTASAALDSVGLGRGSAFSLKLASLVVEAKKKDKDSKDAKKDKKDKDKDKKDSLMAKDKAAKEKAKEKEKAAKEKEKKDAQAAKDKAAKEKAKEKEKLEKEKAAAKAKAEKEKAKGKK